MGQVGRESKDGQNSFRTYENLPVGTAYMPSVVLAFDDHLHFARSMHAENEFHFNVPCAAGSRDKAEIRALGEGLQTVLTL